MSLALPDWPYPATITPRLISARAELVPAFGGDVQRISRMGSCYAVDVVMPPMAYLDAQDWSDIDAETELVTLQLVQPGFDTGAPGSSVVAADGQAGASIQLSGLTPYYVVRRRQWMSVSTDGRLYAYRARSEAVADGDGDITIPLETMLRTPHGEGDVVDLAAPRIEGFPSVPEDAWAVDAAGHVTLSFSIRERG